MSLCNCPICACTWPPHKPGARAGVCVYCEFGEHGNALRMHNRYRICRQGCGYSRGYDAWPEECPACGSSFGPVVLGMDWLSDEEAAAPGWPTLTRMAGARSAAYTRSLKAARKAGGDGG